MKHLEFKKMETAVQIMKGSDSHRGPKADFMSLLTFENTLTSVRL